MTRYFPELVAAATVELPQRCVIDGEIIIATDHSSIGIGACEAGAKSFEPVMSPPVARPDCTEHFQPGTCMRPLSTQNSVESRDESSNALG
jgi:hypothetical protein